VKAKPFLQGAGLATLYIAPFAGGFLTPTLGDAYHRVHPLTSIYRAILIAIVLLWLVGSLGFLLLERLPERWRRMLWLIPLILLPKLFFRGMTGALADSPYLAFQSLRAGHFFTVAAAIVSVILLLFRPAMLDRYIAGSRAFYKIAAFGLLVIVPRIGYQTLHSEPREACSFVRAHLPAVSPAAPRIVWILMDELSYDQVFSSRQADVLLPNFDRLAKSSMVFTQMRPTGDMTEKVLPALLLGKPVLELRKPYPGPPSYRSVAHGPWQPFNEYDTIFADAHSLGWTTGVAGWYNPYCRLLPDVLDRCSWEATGPSVPNISSRLGSTNSVWQNLLLLAPLNLNLPSLTQAPLLSGTDLHRSVYADVMAQSENLIQDGSIRFVFLHLPVPHPPGIYDRAHHSIRNHGTYLDNLVLADETLARLRSTIESTPAAANTTLIVSSDHSWRTFLWRNTPDWSAEGLRATHGGKFDDRPVLMVHFPGSETGELTSKPVNVLAVHTILEALLRGQIRTERDVEHLIGQPPQETISAQVGN
jgi:hypothetical protein